MVDLNPTALSYLSKCKIAGRPDACLQIVPDLIRRLYGPGREVYQDITMCITTHWKSFTMSDPYAIVYLHQQEREEQT